ncbi:hypothetical protein E4U55_000218 [Claviceps digitariae]|nr:hypothetical protein E4U55_000218 [Claviceps digitariae]
MDVDKTLSPVPGSFCDEDVAGLHDNPFKSVQVPQDDSRIQAPATASWSAENRFDIDLGDVDWHRYEPPSVLHKAFNVNSLILLDILTQSIVNVMTRVAEEDQAKQIEEERIRRLEEEAPASKHGKSPGPYLPIIIPAERPLEPDISSMNDMHSRAGTTSASVIAPSTRSSVAAVPVSKDRKDGGRRRNAFRRLFQRAPESGESSFAGGAREALRQKLEARLSRVDIATTDSVTQQALLALRKSGFIAEAEPPKVTEVECVSCLDDIPVAEAVKVPCHSYCKDCFVRLVAAATQHEAQWPPKCCLNQIPFRLIVGNIPDDLKKTFQERSLEWELPVSERVYCSQPECGIWIPPRQIKLNKRQGRCQRGHFTCTICRGSSHGDDDCPQDYEMTLTNMLAEQEGWKRCFNCHAMVEHREACEHMTCRCGSQFCYVCGLQWKTCRCTVDQLNELKEAAARRREQRRLKDEREAEELRAILVQIEEFEREEAARAELERLEQERLEAERWQRQIKERIRFENVRRKEIKAKFGELRTQLDTLHEVQHIMVDAQQEERAASLAQETESTKRQLAERHEAERRQLQHDTLAKIHSKEEQFSKEYSARVATERKVEEGYLEQLRDFWKGKPRAEEEIERGMLPLQMRMDQGHRAWQKWKNEQMLLYKAKVGDGRIVKEEIMYSQRERTKDLCESKEMELTRRMMAEKKWFQEIVRERERLLAEWELQEVEGDADSLFRGEDEEDEEDEDE